MEMIAMLGGLGASGPYLQNPSPAVRAAKNAILAAKTVDEVMVIKVAIPKMNLSEAEAATLLLIADEQIRSITNPTPFYKKPLYWVGVVAVVGVAWHLFLKPGARGLGAGWGSKAKYQMNPGSGKRAAVNPKAGFSKEFDPYAQEKKAIARLDEYFKARRAEARKARKAARKAAKKAGK